MAAYIPTDYIPDAALRLRLYRRMSVAVSLAEIDDLAAELADRFGPIPDPVDNLLFQLRIKVLAAKAGATAVTTDNGQIRIKTALHGLRLFQVQRYLGDGLRVSRDAVWLSRELATHEWQVRLVQVLEKLGSWAGEKMKAGIRPNSDFCFRVVVTALFRVRSKWQPALICAIISSLTAAPVIHLRATQDLHHP